MPWSGAPKLTCDDDDRCGVLRKVVSQTQGKNCWDAVTETAHSLLGMAAVVLLIDKKHGQAAAKYGMDVDTIMRRTSFCAWSLLPVCPEVLYVPDASRDPRFRQNPLVTGEPFIRFYAGASLLHGAHRMGSLCCVDTVPRIWDAHSLNILCNLAAICASDMTREDSIAMCDLRGGKWQVLCCSTSFPVSDDKLVEGSDPYSAADPPREMVLKGVRMQCIPATTSYTPHRIAFVECQHSAFQGIYLLTTCSHTDVLSPTLPKHLYFKCDAGRPSLRDDLRRTGLQIEGLVGKGTHGVVYAGCLFGSAVAVKMMAIAVGRGRTKYKAIAPHNHVLDVTQVYSLSQGIYAVVMKLHCEGSLTHLLDTGFFRSQNSFYDGSVKLTKVYGVAIQIASAFAHLHTHGRVHGNLHSNNVIVRNLGHVMISDCMGLELLTEQSSAAAAAAHSAPEVVRDGILTESADIYSFGILLWQMLTNRQPWAGLSPEAVLTLKCSGKAQLDLDSFFPADVRTLVLRCLDEDMLNRPTAQQLEQSLRVLTTTDPCEFGVYGSQ